MEGRARTIPNRAESHTRAPFTEGGATEITLCSSFLDCLFDGNQIPAGVKDKALLRERIVARIGSLPAEEDTAYGEGYRLLRILGGRLGEDAKAEFAGYVRKEVAQRCVTICVALGELRVGWGVELLAGLLKDRRDFEHWNDSPDPKDPTLNVQRPKGRLAPSTMHQRPTPKEAAAPSMMPSCPMGGVSYFVL